MVIGGGIAGLSCACDLADAGLEVVLLEARPRLGGRAFSFADPEGGGLIDNSQHVLLGCCGEAIGFLDRIGSLGGVEFHDELTVLGAGGERLNIGASFLPAPFHLLPSVLGARCFSAGEKMGLARSMAKVALRGPGKDCAAGNYLRSLHCPAGPVERLIEPVLVSALNERVEQASANYARMVVTEALLKGRQGYRMGVPAAPLSDLVEIPARSYLAERGCNVRTAARVSAVPMAGDRAACAVLECGERVDFDVCVCAVPPWSLGDMGLDAYGGRWLEWRPIVSAHLFFDGAPAEFDPACVVGEPFQWVFNKSRDFGRPSAYVQAVASAAGGIVSLPKSELVECALRAVVRAAPELSGRPVRRAIVFRGRRATFATLGCDALRPGARTPIANLFLAGDWTDTGWPATIEGAVRSGRLAARAAIESL